MPVWSVPKQTADLREEEELQQRILIAQLTPLDIVDQGGGSFTVYIFRKGKMVKKLKSKDIAKIMRQAKVHQDVFNATGIHMLAEDNTIADFSHVDSTHYPLIAQWFVTYWLRAGCFIKPDPIIRQTGKIRAKLHEKGNEQLLEKWNEAMEAALTGFPNADYALLSNEEEARLEGECFFGHTGNLAFFETNLQVTNLLTNIVGAGIGSSSTQFYAMTENGKLVVAFDPTLGSKPTGEEKAAIVAGNPKTAQAFEDAFKALFKWLLEQGVTLHLATFIATNAIGYCAANLGKELGEGNRFSEHVSSGLPATVDDYINALDGCTPSWNANIILGMLLACKEVGISHVVMEQKNQHGKKGLPIEISWTTALARDFPKSPLTTFRLLISVAAVVVALLVNLW